MKEQIGKRLRDLRTGIHLTQVELAKALGTQQSTINRYEQGQSAPVRRFLSGMQIILTCPWIICIAARTIPGANCISISRKR